MEAKADVWSVSPGPMILKPPVVYEAVAISPHQCGLCVPDLFMLFVHSFCYILGLKWWSKKDSPLMQFIIY